VLERLVFRHQGGNVYLVADAYQGKKIKQAISQFLGSAAGARTDSVTVGALRLPIAGGAEMLVYIGHNGLMDFSLDSYPKNSGEKKRDVIILACKSRQFFSEAIKLADAEPVLWTTGLMAPEAYTLKDALEGWISREPREKIRERAAASYDKYQKCGLTAARRLLVSGW